MKKIISLCVVVAALLLSVRAADALPASYLESGWVDLDKYWSFDQGYTYEVVEDDGSITKYSYDGFTTNYYYDGINGDKKWEPGEIWTNHEVELDSDGNKIVDAGWVAASDNSCWMASAAAMLSHQLNLVAREIYDEMLSWAAEDSRFYWTEGNLAHVALQEYLKRHDLTKEYYVKPYSTYSFAGNLGWIDNSYDFAKDQLYRYGTVGLGFWGIERMGHAVTFWGWNETSLILADSDKYPWDITGYTTKVDKSGWTLDYDPVDKVFEREVRYLVVLAPVPEPETWLLLAFGLTGLALFQRKKTRNR